MSDDKKDDGVLVTPVTDTIDANRDFGLSGLNVLRYTTEEPGKPKGRPIFTTHDIQLCYDYITLLTRLFCIRNGLTYEAYSEFYESWAAKHDVGNKKTNSDKANLKRAIVQDKVTYDRLARLVEICGYDITDITLTLHNVKTNEEQVISVSDHSDIMYNCQLENESKADPGFVFDSDDGEPQDDDDNDE